MADLTFRTARTLIERGIIETISLPYQTRLPTVADVAALRAIASKSTPPDSLRYVTAQGYCYRFKRFATGTDDSDTIIKPSDITTGNGRWLKTTSAVTSGYLKQVQLYNDSADVESIIERLLGQRPSVLVVWTSTDEKPKSTSPGALYWSKYYFDIWVFCTSLREDGEALEGSGIAAELAKDPGVNAIIGDVKSVIAGSALGVTGVSYAEITKEEPILVDLSQRTAVQKLSITVYATVHQPDTDLVTLDSVRAIDAQWQTVTGTGNVGASNYVVSGLTVPTATGLTQTIASGSAYVSTTLVSPIAQAFTFPASKYTYLDLKSDGTWVGQSVAFGQDAPTTTTGALRVWVVATDAAGVTGSNMLSSSQIDYGTPQQIPKP